MNAHLQTLPPAIPGGQPLATDLQAAPAVLRGELRGYQRDILDSVEALASAVRSGDWRAAEASDRAMREAVLALAASVEQGQVDENRARETLVTVHGEHLKALEQARALANDMRERLSRIGVGRRASDLYRRAAVLS